MGAILAILQIIQCQKTFDPKPSAKHVSAWPTLVFLPHKQLPKHLQFFLRGWLPSFWQFEGLAVPLITENLMKFHQKSPVLSSDVCLQTSLWFNNEHLILIFSDLCVPDDTSYFRIEAKNTRKHENYWIITTWIISFIFWTKNRQKKDITNFTELVTAPYIIDWSSWKSPNNF